MRPTNKEGCGDCVEADEWLASGAYLSGEWDWKVELGLEDVEEEEGNGGKADG